VTRPRSLLALAVGSYLVVVVAAVESPRGCFTPGWFNVVTWIFLPLALLSTFAAVFAYGRRQGWHVLGSIVGSLVSAALLGGITVYVTFAITIDPGCFS
jgi:hypothetical protein